MGKKESKTASIQEYHLNRDILINKTTLVVAFRKNLVEENKKI